MPPALFGPGFFGPTFFPLSSLARKLPHSAKWHLVWKSRLISFALPPLSTACFSTKAGLSCRPSWAWLNRLKKAQYQPSTHVRSSYEFPTQHFEVLELSNAMIIISALQLTDHEDRCEMIRMVGKLRAGNFLFFPSKKRGKNSNLCGYLFANL